MISIICPVFNEEKFIANCLDSIMKQDYPMQDLEVIIVDGMSTDRTREIVAEYSERYPFIRLVDNPKRIVPTAMNLGIKASNGDTIIRLDAHAIFPDNYFSELVWNLASLKAENVGGVCKTLPVSDTPVCVAIANVLSSSFGMGNSRFRIGTSEVMEVDTVPFGCFHRDLFERIGFFDEDLVRNQDDEFNGRIIKNGGKVFLLPQLEIKYYARDKVSKVFNMFYQYGLFKPLVNKKLGSPATLRQFFPLLFVLALLVGPILILFLPWLLPCYVIMILSYFALGTWFSSRYSHSVKQILLQDWVYFVVHFGYGWGYLCGLMKLLLGKPFAVEANR